MHSIKISFWTRVTTKRYPFHQAKIMRPKCPIPSLSTQVMVAESGLATSLPTPTPFNIACVVSVPSGKINEHHHCHSASPSLREPLTANRATECLHRVPLLVRQIIATHTVRIASRQEQILKKPTQAQSPPQFWFLTFNIHPYDCILVYKKGRNINI